MNDLSLIEAEFGDLSPWMEAPAFWVSTPDYAATFIESLRDAEIRVIGRSAGGRGILTIEYGEKEPLAASSDSLQSSLAAPEPAGTFPASFYGAERRKKPVVVLQGALHGSELCGTVASVNLCRVIEAGDDLRGKAWPRLAELARAARVAVIPWLNTDGAARWPLANTSGVPDALYDRCHRGVARDGTELADPAAKHIFPVPPEEAAYLGACFNDAGVDLEYDFCLPERQPETTAWMKYYLSERPDAVVVWQGSAGALAGPPARCLPDGLQRTQTRLAGAVRARLLREGYDLGRMRREGPAQAVVAQSTAVYLTCGALPVPCDLPAGTQSHPFTCDQMLDIGLITIEEILLYAHHGGLRP